MSGAKDRFKLLTFNMQFGQPWDDAYPDHAPIDLDTLVRTSGLTESDTTAQLVELELFGHARREPDGRWSRG